jgi:hypothetical protein
MRTAVDNRYHVRQGTLPWDFPQRHGTISQCHVTPRNPCIVMVIRRRTARRARGRRERQRTLYMYAQAPPALSIDSLSLACLLLERRRFTAQRPSPPCRLGRSGARACGSLSRCYFGRKSGFCAERLSRCWTWKHVVSASLGASPNRRHELAAGLIRGTRVASNSGRPMAVFRVRKVRRQRDRQNAYHLSTAGSRPWKDARTPGLLRRRLRRCSVFGGLLERRCGDTSGWCAAPAQIGRPARLILMIAAVFYLEVTGRAVVVDG